MAALVRENLQRWLLPLCEHWAVVIDSADWSKSSDALRTIGLLDMEHATELAVLCTGLLAANRVGCVVIRVWCGVWCRYFA